jgi:TRAP-type C4-dicarboxylate transport system permease small subunit
METAKASLFQQAFAIYSKSLRAVVMALAAVAGAAIVAMILVTCADIVMRLFRHPLIGAYDIVNIAGTITIACAMPYTTAVKGHVAIEFFFHKLRRRGRIIMDIVIRLLMLALFSALAWGCFRHGQALRENGQVTPTLQMPEFWVAYLVAGSCAAMVLVTIHHLLKPGKPMIEP